MLQNNNPHQNWYPLDPTIREFESPDISMITKIDILQKYDLGREIFTLQGGYHHLQPIPSYYSTSMSLFHYTTKQGITEVPEIL